MAKKSLSALKTLSGDETAPKKKPTPATLTKAQLDQFGDYAGSTDVKAKAAYLAKKGLIGADQLLSDHPDLSSKEGIINAQSDWKTGATAAMLIRARKAGLKTPTEVKANWQALTGALEPRLREAINHPVFNQIHPNYKDTFASILADRYASEATSQPLSSLATSLAKK